MGIIDQKRTNDWLKKNGMFTIKCADYTLEELNTKKTTKEKLRVLASSLASFHLSMMDSYLNEN